MKNYIADLLEIAKDDKCQHCIRMQHELRRMSRIVDDNQLQGRMRSAMLDHDLHYSLGCKPCDTILRKKEFSKS